jgi:hypothetical protein
MKRKDGPPLGKKAQATLELTMAIVCIFLLFWACTKVFLWVNSCLVTRQYQFEQTRNDAGSTSNDNPIQVDDSWWNLQFFPGH